jgi:predicted permease
MRNLKFALRTLFKTPFVTGVAILSLALGIGANAAIFSIFDKMLLGTLPVHNPFELVNLAAPEPKPGSQSCTTAGNCDVVLSYPMFRDLQRMQTVFTEIAAHRSFYANLAFDRQTMVGRGTFVSGSYFPVLGIRPALGRLITPDDDKKTGEAPVVVLSHAYWTSRFAQRPDVIDKTMIVNGQTLTIVGVAPKGFDGTTLGETPLVYVPITLRGKIVPGFNGFDNRRNYWAYTFARLRPGVSMDQARSAMNGVYHGIINDVEAPLQRGMSEQTMKRFREKPLLLEPGHQGQTSVRGETRVPLIMLLAVTGLVLLIACANIANLLLARGAARSGEMAVRLSIGANRGILIRQLLGESLLLAALGAAAGILVAQWTLQLIVSMLPPDAAAMIQPRIDTRVMLFAGAVALGTGILFGLFPALNSTRPDLLSSLKGQAGQPSGARGAAWFRTGLATAQIALSMALLIAAGLFVKSLANVSRVDLGMRIDNIVTFSVSPELNGYTPDRSSVLFRRLEEELAAQPGVTGVAAALVPVLAGDNWGSDVTVEGFPRGPDINTNSRFNMVGPGYFKTMGVPMVAGREFTAQDILGAPKVVVVNQAFVRKFNLGDNAVGKRMTDDGDKLDMEIVGVAADAKYSEVRDAVPPLYFRPYKQGQDIGALTFYTRTDADPKQLQAAVPRVVASLDPNLPIDNLQSLPQLARENTFLDRFIGVMAGSFAALATLLAAIGLYGVLAYTVSQRTREIGLRMALGAPPARVRSMVLRQVAVMTLVGGLIGVTLSFWVGRQAKALLYEMTALDPAVYAGAILTLALVALAAGFIPAHRASKVDPMTALRYQ